LLNTWHIQCFLSELLKLLRNNIVPTPNTSPSSEYEASHMLKKFGLAYDVINACIKGYMLFRGIHANVDHCVHCGELMYRWAEKLKVARKVFRHFPFALRLTWIYSVPNPSKVDGVASPQLQPRQVGKTCKKITLKEFCGNSLARFYHGASQCTIGTSNKWGEPIWSPTV